MLYLGTPKCDLAWPQSRRSVFAICKIVAMRDELPPKGRLNRRCIHVKIFPIRFRLSRFSKSFGNVAHSFSVFERTF
jgi:hypothetical protein